MLTIILHPWHRPRSEWADGNFLFRVLPKADLDERPLWVVDSTGHDRQQSAKSCLSIPPNKTQAICFLLPLNAVHRNVGDTDIQFEACIERFFGAL
ncbi:MULTISPECIES: hypothetical protein [Pseudomonas]|uniref:hypothetical protein n=1 Tax=Pseudomonas TaxID=286 RepID=UPI0010418899|nr:MULTISPECIES: hypothetical protein [Pseudomonas]